MEIVKRSCLIDGVRGVYIPQRFAELYPEWVEYEEDLKILLEGPEHPDYWDAWESVVFREWEDNGERCYLEQDGDLFLCCSRSDLIGALLAWANGEFSEYENQPVPQGVKEICAELLQDTNYYLLSEVFDMLPNTEAGEWIRRELQEIEKGRA